MDNLAENERSKDKPLEKSDWVYSQLREYLLALTRNPNFLLPRDQYPNTIELDSSWHKLLNLLRSQTSKDSIERWAGIGFKQNRQNQRAIYLPEFSTKGLYDYVPSEVIEAERNRMVKVVGMDGLIGDIHSHPPLVTWKYIQDVLNLLDEGSFSIADLYTQIHIYTDLSLMGVVDGKENLFAFRSQESKTQDVSLNLMSQDNFEKYWYEKNGYKYRGSIKKFGLSRAIPISPLATSPWNICKQVAERHRLVLYKGTADRKLVKIPTEPLVYVS